MINEAIKKLIKTVNSPETPVSVSRFICGRTYSFPAMIELQKTDNVMYVTDIRSLYDTTGVHSINDFEKYQYTRFYIECLYTISFGIPSVVCSISLEGTDDSLEMTTIPLGAKHSDAHNKLIASLIKKCSKKVEYQEHNYDQFALQEALMSQNHELQYN